MSAGQDAPRVLVIDDDQLLTGILAKVLAADGFMVAVANAGHEGLERAASASPAVVIVDLTMPVMDGFEFIEAFRASPRYAAIPIILATGTSAIAEARKRIASMGVVLIMTKPFDLDTLLAAVHSLTRDRS